MQYMSYISDMHQRNSQENRIRQERAQLGMTQEELARKAGITRQTVGLIEKGAYNPTLDLCLKLCRALEKTLDQLFWPGDVPVSRETRDLPETLGHPAAPQAKITSPDPREGYPREEHP